MNEERHLLEELNKKIIRCKKCTRLSKYIKKVAKEKVKRFQEENYWRRSLPGFRDPKAELLIVGLAPAAYGSSFTHKEFIVICSYPPSRQNIQTG